MDDKESVMRIIQEIEQSARSDPLYRTNLFIRPGVTAGQVAAQLQWWKTGPNGQILTTRSGQKRTDTWRAKRALESLVEEGKLIKLGPSRTMAAGSRYLTRYATPEFVEWLKEEARR